MEQTTPLPVSQAVIDNICQRFHVCEMGLFGSVARGTAGEGSDIDLFVEFEPGYHPRPGWFALEEELEAALGRPVDLSRKALLKPRVRVEALRDAVLIYAVRSGRLPCGRGSVERRRG